jgi:hypothetical protein
LTEVKVTTMIATCQINQLMTTCGGVDAVLLCRETSRRGIIIPNIIFCSVKFWEERLERGEVREKLCK